MDLHYSSGIQRERDPKAVELENNVFSGMQSIINDAITKDENLPINKPSSNIIGVEQAIKELLNDEEYLRLYGMQSFDDKL